MKTDLRDDYTSPLKGIINALERHGGTCSVQELTMRRDTAILQGLRPDLPFRKQVNYWAEQNGLICVFNSWTRLFSFKRA
jgi:hypothetical protein